MFKSVLFVTFTLGGVLACSSPAPQAIGPPLEVNPTYGPVPSFAVSPPLNSDGYRIEDFGQGAYMITNGYYQAMALVSTEGLIMVDAPPSIGQNLLYAVGNITHLPITHQVYSHSHTDHIGASSLYGNVTRIGHRLTLEYLILANDSNRPLPDKMFSDEMTLIVGNQTLDLKHKGPNHSPDNCYIYAPALKFIFPKWSPYLFLGKVEDIPGYILAHKYALEYDFEHLVAGHLTLSGTRQDVEDSYKLS